MTTQTRPDCNDAYWFTGCIIPRNGNYPERAWGTYLPGDEPGYMCRETEDYCSEHNCPKEDRDDV